MLKHRFPLYPSFFSISLPLSPLLVRLLWSQHYVALAMLAAWGLSERASEGAREGGSETPVNKHPWASQSVPLCRAILTGPGLDRPLALRAVCQTREDTLSVSLTVALTNRLACLSEYLSVCLVYGCP